ncbi:MAG: sensor domain-containing diguanylate cyclase, partial [Elusimicrobiales bacterium]|nr:sensor domain-containing diguanylate cyclase [Elusimicrobiales bacterium]
MKRKFKLLSVTLSFAFVIYIVLANKALYPGSILLFIIPFLLLNYKEVEISFVMLVISSISIFIATKLHSASLLETFINFASFIVFYIIKNIIEKKNSLEEEKLYILKNELIKKINEVESDIEFYNNYITKKIKTTDFIKRLTSFLKEIEDSKSDEETLRKVTKAIKMIFPDSSSLFIVSPYLSPVIEDIFRTKTPLFIPSTSKDTRYDKKVWKEEEKSIVLIPIIVFSKILAVLSVSSKQENYFSQDDFITLEIIANTASTTLENISLYKTIDDLARKDQLTGVFTRRVFEEKIEEEILVSARTKQPFCLFIIDIDHFKRINDTYGHQFGDKVLKEVAKAIMQNLREFDFVCRYGGEEFAIIMPNTTKKASIVIANNISNKISEIEFTSNN